MKTSFGRGGPLLFEGNISQLLFGTHKFLSERNVARADIVATAAFDTVGKSQLFQSPEIIRPLMLQQQLRAKCYGTNRRAIAATNAGHLGGRRAGFGDCLYVNAVTGLGDRQSGP